jgi:hypothetical protein
MLLTHAMYTIPLSLNVIQAFLPSSPPSLPPFHGPSHTAQPRTHIYDTKHTHKTKNSNSVRPGLHRLLPLHFGAVGAVGQADGVGPPAPPLVPRGLGDVLP